MKKKWKRGRSIHGERGKGNEFVSGQYIERKWVKGISASK
jgi:hypothetical protein